MYVCRGCLRNLAGAAAGALVPRTLGPLRARTVAVSSARSYSSDADSVRAAMEAALSETKSKPETKPPSREKDQANDDEVELGYDHVDPRGGALARQKYEKKLEKGVKKHLSMMPDPFHIAQYISTALSKDKFDEALMMTRMASRSKKVEVSWNHLIDYLLKKHRLHAAIKLYNEMKKRAQIPNAKTYTIIFRGCAISPHPKLAVSEATRIYNFMLKYGPLKPNTIHMNAVLDVCGRAGDLESLFTILTTANTSIRSPDAHTYTIVLNALRHDAERMRQKNQGLVDEEIRREIQANIQRARALWIDVITNWRNARLVLDEHLVVAMGRMLTLGESRDNEGVLDLLEQAMKIPRLDKPDVKLPPMPPAKPGEDSAADASPTSQGASPSSPSAPRAAPSLSNAPLYAKPSQKTLSLALTALTNLRKTSHASKYWDYLTRLHSILPDADNYYCYLRALAVGHNSEKVALLISSFPRDFLGPDTFRRGFTTCINDNLNPNAFAHACRIFDVMVSTRRYPDPMAMRLFLQASRLSTKHFYKAFLASGSRKDELEALGHHGRQLAAAVDRMWEPFRILASSLSYPTDATRSPEELLARQRNDVQEVMATARAMLAAMDRALTTEGMLGKSDAKFWKARRVVLQRAVERWIDKLYSQGKDSGGAADGAADKDEGWVALEEDDIRAKSSRQRRAVAQHA
ncbi:hypothetical protein VTJ83DRAFT_1282 [Remersonia thermophila]|uniref:Pentatricopeptide repeat protein n=1 Tax=Remersonia thermophila TaxID=72144 RepID=A0ABR4DPG8_9PEZI